MSDETKQASEQVEPTAPAVAAPVEVPTSVNETSAVEAQAPEQQSMFTSAPPFTDINWALLHANLYLASNVIPWVSGVGVPHLSYDETDGTICADVQVNLDTIGQLSANAALYALKCAGQSAFVAASIYIPSPTKEQFKAKFYGFSATAGISNQQFAFTIGESLLIFA
jgi:hypothetical protein